VRLAAAIVAACCTVGVARANDAMPESLTGVGGDPARGRAIVVNRQVGLCLLCHSGPFPEERLQGNLATDLRGAGRRWSEGQLRLRLVDPARINPATIMPAYHRTEGLARVAPAYRGKPILTAEQIEDVVAFLLTLTEIGGSGAAPSEPPTGRPRGEGGRSERGRSPRGNGGAGTIRLQAPR
jgi:sulfur-oxidizing protein SoxX